MDDDGRSGRWMAGGSMGKLTHLEAFMSDDAKRGRVWTDSEFLTEYRRLRDVLQCRVPGQNNLWFNSESQVVTKLGGCRWADEPKTLTPQGALLALADGKVLRSSDLLLRLDSAVGTVVADVVYTGPSPSKPSSREQRRARKAAKNLYMWRTFGDRRKWNENRFSKSSCGRYPMRCGKNDWILINANDTLYLNGAHGLRNVRHDVLAALREPSGFKAMSRLATEIAKGDRGKKSAQELSNEIWSGII